MSNNAYPLSTGMVSPDLYADRYQLGESLGTGSFGEVFAAYDRGVNPPKSFAIKILSPQFLKDKAVRANLERELDSLTLFNGHHIVPVIDFIVEPKQACIVTELVESGSLTTRMEAAPDGRIPLPEVVVYLEQICRMLQDAHVAGLVHLPCLKLAK